MLCLVHQDGEAVAWALYVSTFLPTAGAHNSRLQHCRECLASLIPTEVPRTAYADYVYKLARMAIGRRHYILDYGSEPLQREVKVCVYLERVHDPLTKICLVLGGPFDAPLCLLVHHGHGGVVEIRVRCTTVLSDLAVCPNTSSFPRVMTKLGQIKPQPTTAVGMPSRAAEPAGTETAYQGTPSPCAENTSLVLLQTSERSSLAKFVKL